MRVSLVLPCTPLVYSLGALCSFFIYILLFTDKKKIKVESKNQERRWNFLLKGMETNETRNETTSFLNLYFFPKKTCQKKLELENIKKFMC